jgi:hypothetical protein
MNSKNETEVVEYSRDKKIVDPNSLVLDGDSEIETPPNRGHSHESLSRPRNSVGTEIGTASWSIINLPLLST